MMILNRQLSVDGKQEPVYHHDMVTVTASETGDGLDLRLESYGELCATGRAGAAVCAIDDPRGFRDSASTPGAPRRKASRRRADPAGRPLAGNASVPGQPRGGIGNICAMSVKACRSMPIRRWDIPAHYCISAIGYCATMSYWGRGMYVGSRIEHFAVARIGDELSARALITDNYEHKGHRFVALDVLVVCQWCDPNSAHCRIPRSTGRASSLRRERALG